MRGKTEYTMSTNYDIKQNTVKWEYCTNRHPTTAGNAWGWIEGTLLTWSNDGGSSFTSKQASELVIAHKKWLEDSRPVELKLIDARNQLAGLEISLARKRTEFLEAETAYNAKSEEISRLIEQKT